RFLYDADEVGRVGHVAVVEDEPLVLLMRVLVEVLDAPGVERGRAALDAVDDIALVEQQLAQIGPVLARDPGDQCDFAHGCSVQRSLPLAAAGAKRKHDAPAAPHLGFATSLTLLASPSSPRWGEEAVAGKGLEARPHGST